MLLGNICGDADFICAHHLLFQVLGFIKGYQLSFCNDQDLVADEFLNYGLMILVDDIPIKIAELGLSRKAYINFIRGGIKPTMFVKDFCKQYSEKDLLKIPNFGKRTLKDVADKLAKYNFTLKEE